MELECNAKSCLLPVTALEFCNFHGSRFLISGEGPLLKVFSDEGWLISVQEALPFTTVHGIRPASGSDSAVLLVFGQKVFCISELTSESNGIFHPSSNNACYSLSFVSEPAELPDWILDVAWLQYKDPSCYKIAFVTAHNAVLVYTVASGSTTAFTYHSEVSCILYSAHALWCGDGCGLTLASGTVFNKILLWHLTSDDLAKDPRADTRVKVQLTLSGHEGVIFSIKFSNDKSMLISASDDRTVRLWALPSSWQSSPRSEEIRVCQTLYGHMARVWDARLLQSCIVSIGEDVTCRVWDLQGHCHEVIKGHKGRSIWSMAVDHERQVIATGGGDCSVRTFHLHSSAVRTADTRLPSLSRGEADKADTPRSVVLAGRTALCLTNKGYLYSATVSDNLYQSRGGGCDVWREVLHDTEFSGYCVMSVSEAQPCFVAIGNLTGSIKLLSISDQGTVDTSFQWKAHEAKVFSLNWNVADSALLLFSCGPNGAVVYWNVHEKAGKLTVSSLFSLSLPPSKHRWISAVKVLPYSNSPSPVASATPSSPATVVVCGDRKGSVHVYHCVLEPSRTAESAVYQGPVQSLRLHGPNGVTSITACGQFVYTAGRDGYCRKFSLGSDGLLVEHSKFKWNLTIEDTFGASHLSFLERLSAIRRIHYEKFRCITVISTETLQPVKGMDWIEKLMFYKEDLLVLGFHTTNMILHSTVQNKRIMEVNCGGGHRSYGASTFNEMISERRCLIVFLKQSLVCFRELDLRAYFTQPVWQHPFVGREAVSMCILYEDQLEGNHLVAIGSEDCTVSLARICPSGKDHTEHIKIIKTLQGHISSVRALSCSPSEGGGAKKLLFSGGARASLKVWCIGQAEKELDVSLEAELYLHDEDPQRPRRHRAHKISTTELPPECRVMSLTSFPLAAVVAGENCSLPNSPKGCYYVAAGCSDALIRQYIYNEGGKSFTQLPCLSFHNKCILCVAHFFYLSPPDCCPSEHRAFLCSTATDGRVAVWCLDRTIRECLLEQCPPSSSCNLEGQDKPAISSQPSCVFAAHQSGINAISLNTVELGDGESLLVASVGDDNALTLSELKVTTGVVSGGGEPVVSLTSQCCIKTAHSSSITGVKFLESGALLVTTSVDQRLNVWSHDSTTLKLVSSFTHDVADAASLQVLRNRDSMCVIFCGIGIQYFCLTHTT